MRSHRRLVGAHEPRSDRTTDLAQDPKSVGTWVRTTAAGLTTIVTVGTFVLREGVMRARARPDAGVDRPHRGGLMR